MSMENPFATGDAFDDSVLALERLRMCMERVDDTGDVGDIDTHDATALNLALLGERITTIGVGLTNPQVVRAHSLRESSPSFQAPQRRRSAYLCCIAEALEGIYQDSGAVARETLRGSVDSHRDDDERYSPLLDIATCFGEGPQEELFEIVERSVLGGV